MRRGNRCLRELTGYKRKEMWGDKENFSRVTWKGDNIYKTGTAGGRALLGRKREVAHLECTPTV